MKIKKFINQIRVKYLNQAIEVDSKQVRRLMLAYFNIKEWSYYQTITSIKTYESKKGLIIEIKTHRPGLLIGKNGIFIDGLKYFFKASLKRDDVKINLKECKMWINLF